MQNLFGVIVNHDNTESLGKNARELRKNPQSLGKNTVLVITIYSFFLFGIFNFFYVNSYIPIYIYKV